MVRRFVSFVWLLVLLPTAAAAERQETWQAIAVRGQRIGYGHLVITREVRAGQTLVASRLRLHSVLKRFDGKVTLIVDQEVEEQENGNLLRFRYQLDNPPAARVEMIGRVADGRLHLQTTAGGQTTRTTLPVPADLKSPGYPDRWLEERPPAPGEAPVIQLFDPQIGAVLTVRITPRGPAEFASPGGEKQTGARFTLEYLDGIPGLTIESYRNAAGRIVLNEAPLLGTTTWSVSREAALQELPDDVDVGLAALIHVPRIENAAQLREAVYRLTAPDGLPDDLFPSGPMQSVERIDPRTVRITVRALRPGEAPAGPVLPPPPPEEYRAATSMARSDDPEIVRLATQSAPADAPPEEIARRLERAVHGWLTRKNMSTSLASASEVVRSRAGDCTEHAVLLTALLRARGLPARVAVGLVYWDRHSAFAGHAWTEVWLDGRWVPLDATQPQGGCGADRLKLADSSLADGDAGLIAGAVSTWRLLDTATIEVERVVASPAGGQP